MGWDVYGIYKSTGPMGKHVLVRTAVDKENKRFSFASVTFGGMVQFWELPARSCDHMMMSLSRRSSKDLFRVSNTAGYVTRGHFRVHHAVLHLSAQ